MKMQFFRFDGDDSPVFAGQSSGFTWNGWECPLLTIDAMEKLRVCLAGEEWVHPILRDGDTFKVQEPRLAAQTIKSRIVDGVRLYDMRGYGFCFSECDEAGKFL